VTTKIGDLVVSSQAHTTYMYSGLPSKKNFIPNARCPWLPGMLGLVVDTNENVHDDRGLLGSRFVQVMTLTDPAVFGWLDECRAVLVQSSRAPRG